MVVLFVVAKFVNEELVFSVEDSWLMFVSIVFLVIKGADSFGIVAQKLDAIASNFGTFKSI